MWKTTHPESTVELDRSSLCPSCDSIGPHWIMVDDRHGEDAWLVCIDCGADLGRLTPQGIDAYVSPEPMAPMNTESPEPVDLELMLRALVETVAKDADDSDFTPRSTQGSP